MNQNQGDFSPICGLNRATRRIKRNDSSPRLGFPIQRYDMRHWLKLCLAFGVALAVAGCGGGRDDTVIIGIAGPITGGSAAFGAQLKRGGEQAIEDVNASGGILGKKIQSP